MQTKRNFENFVTGLGVHIIVRNPNEYRNRHTQGEGRGAIQETKFRKYKSRQSIFKNLKNNSRSAEATLLLEQ